jgi:hypothetical protein
MEQFMGNLFFRRVQPSEIEAMTYGKMKYWNEWHKRMEAAEIAAIEKGKKVG